ncbi:SHOCT domain-containing protein [Alteribacillus bidgolensis]|uniref:Putative membrane protein n=1 Tax=Alteribacillus bidgolensis TaxID=930129 RepID=A0A1G8R6W2_9BACI|nr:SHOCT domain-containing protein [Alteribacillus bidgolensis]SDJ12315.1 putative membrane protein [Alteribacillus bidgolensis]
MMMNSGMGFLWMILWIVVLGLVIYGGLRLILSKKEEEDPAIQILKEKFARGEISEAEYNRRKKVLLKS